MKMIERTKKSLFIKEIGEAFWFSNEQFHAGHRVWLSYVVGTLSVHVTLLAVLMTAFAGYVI
jgi:hypothetical protein